MFPLIQANSGSSIFSKVLQQYTTFSKTQSCFQPHLATLSKNHKVIYFEHMGGFDDYASARDYMNKMYAEHGNDNVIYIVNVGMEPWFLEWFDVKHEFKNYDNINFWHCNAGPLTQSCDKNWIYIPYWKKFVDCNLSRSQPEPTNNRRDQKVSRKYRMFFWMRRHYTYRIELLKRLVNSHMEMEIRCPHVLTEIERPDISEPLKKHFDNWGSIKNRITNEGQDLIAGENGAMVDSYDSRVNFQLEIVSETRVNGGPLTTFASEKTFRALRSGNLSLYWAQQHHINNLRRKGWKFFDRYIDHSYDNERNPLRRLNKLNEEISRLYHLSDKEWQDIWYNTNKDREHNMNRSLHVDAGLNKFMKRYI